MVYTEEMVLSVMQNSSSHANSIEQIVDISLDEVLESGTVAKTKLKKATMLNLRNKASIITAASRSFIKNATPAVNGGDGRFILNTKLGNDYIINYRITHSSL